MASADTRRTAKRRRFAARVLVVSILAVQVVACIFTVVFCAIAVHRSSQGTAYSDVEALARADDELKRIWGDKGALSALQGTLAQKNVDLQDASRRLASADPLAVSRLGTVSANLSYLEEVLRNERRAAASAVRDMDERVKALQKTIGPEKAWDALIEALFKQGGGFLAAIVWPLVLLALFVYLVRSPDAPRRLRSLLGGFKSVKLGIAEVVLNDSEQAKATTEDAFAGLRLQAKLHFDLWVQRTNLRQKLEEVVEAVKASVKDGTGEEMDPSTRCTLHVEDIVFADTLYQLLDYFPTTPIQGRGRVFSVRFGIIGRAWRLKESQTQGQVVTKARDLIEQWGMTSEEAKSAASSRKSFLCVLLKDADKGLVGVFYMDAKGANAFRAKGPKTLPEVVEEACRGNGLVKDLARMKDELSGLAPLIRIYER
jgi:hypothetical protein